MKMFGAAELMAAKIGAISFSLFSTSSAVVHD